MYDVVKNDAPAKQVYVSAEDLQDALMQKKTADVPSKPQTIVKRGGKKKSRSGLTYRELLVIRVA